MDTGTALVIGIVLLLVAAIVYFTPTIVANRRNHNNAGAILILNIFLGWTFIGWVIALVWANTDNVRAPKIVETPKQATLFGDDQTWDVGEYRS